MTLSKKPGKVIWILFLLVFFNAFQMVLLNLFGEAVIAVDMFLNLTTTNSGEVSELLGNLLPAVFGVCVLYMSALGLGVVSIINKSKVSERFIKRQRIIGLSLLGVSGICIGANYITNSNFEIKDDIYPINVCYNVGLAVERNIKTNHYHETSKNFTFNAQSTHPKEEKEIYIFVVGETARAENMGIYGYEKNTTPELSKMQGLVVFPDALTQSNTTHKSVPMLLSAASAENYDCIYKQKSIITAFKEAGFSTAFCSNQRPNHSFIDFFAEEADHKKFTRTGLPDNTNIYDESLIDFVKNELLTNKSNKIFIVLHMYGSHFNFEERYPKDMAIFKPDSVVSVDPKLRNVLINAYDNSIHYTDAFLGKLIKMIEETSASSAIIYTSDHGEDIFDDSRELFLHASPVPSAYQLHVPYLVWVSNEYKELHADNYKYLINNRLKPISTNIVTFHTLLSLGGIKTSFSIPQYSLVDSVFQTEKHRHYLNDHNLPEHLDNIGMKKEDIALFKKNNIVFP